MNKFQYCLLSLVGIVTLAMTGAAVMNPRPVFAQGQGRVPFQANKSMLSMPNGIDAIALDFGEQVPGGRVTVIRHVLVGIKVPTGQFVEAHIICTTQTPSLNLSGTSIPLSFTLQGTFGGLSNFVANQQVLCYSTTGYLFFAVTRSSPQGNTGVVQASVSGYSTPTL